VVTVVHNPEDARIRQREINALITARWNVTYVAPFRGFGLEVPPSRPADLGRGSLRCINIARSSGRRRLRAWQAARTVMRALAQDHDVVLVHDPELVLAAAGLGMKNLIWDVHEDPAAALHVKSWTDGAVNLQVIGEAHDPQARQALESATAAGDLTWLGFVPSEEALARVAGSLAGLCLLRDLPNYRVSLSTKIVEYCALGVPVITTPLPLAADLIRSENVGFAVPWDDPRAVVDAIMKLRDDSELRVQMGANGHRVALREHDWNRLSADFVRVMDGIAADCATRRRIAERELL